MKRNEAEENSCLEYLYMLRKHYRKQKQDWKTRKDSNPINKYTIIPYNTLEESGRTFFPCPLPGLHTCLSELRHQFRPSSLCSRHVTEFHTTPVAHASVTFCNTRHRLSISFGRVSHQASPSRHTPSSAHPSLFFHVDYRRVPAAE